MKKNNKAFDEMANAIANYIKSMGGTAVVVGSVGMGKEVGALKFNYFIKINITGKMPTKKNL